MARGLQLSQGETLANATLNAYKNANTNQNTKRQIQIQLSQGQTPLHQRQVFLHDNCLHSR